MAELCTREEEVREDSKDTDKNYNVYLTVVGKKRKGYLWDTSNMDMDMDME